MEKKWTVTFTLNEKGVLIAQEIIGLTSLELLGLATLLEQEVLERNKKNGPRA